MRFRGLLEVKLADKLNVAFALRALDLAEDRGGDELRSGARVNWSIGQAVRFTAELEVFSLGDFKLLPKRQIEAKLARSSLDARARVPEGVRMGAA